MRNPRLTTCLLTALALPCLPLPAATWTGAGDGWSWSNLDNWEEGALPAGGETVWIRPVAGSGWVEIGGATDGGALRLVLDSPINLSLELNPEARIAGVTTLDAGWHRLGGKAPEAMSDWHVMGGGALALGNLAEGSTLVKTGQGTLALEPAASGAGGLRVVGWDGSVTLEVEDPLAIAGATLEARGAFFSFGGEVARVGKLVLGEGAFGPMSGGGLAADEIVVSRSGYLDFSLYPRVATEVLRIESGVVRLGGVVETGRIVLSMAVLELDGTPFGGVLEVGGGWLEGGVVAGEMRLDAAAGMAGWMGSGRLAEGGRLTWKPVEDESAAFWVMGELVFEEGSVVAISEADWSSPYWDSARTFAFIDIWGGGIVQGMPGLQDGRVAGEGNWGIAADGQGGLALTWNPEAAPVPEAATLGWGAALALGAAVLRRGARSGGLSARNNRGRRR